MSNHFVPKEQLSAYQRWEMSSFDVNLPTADEVESIHRQAREEGFSTGYQVGNQTSLAEVQRLQKLVSGLQQEIQKFDDNIAHDLLKLALDIAKQVVREALHVKPELILPVVREALTMLPQYNTHVSLVLHPADAVLVRAKMGDQLAHTGWKIIEDTNLSRGGCRIETANTQIDATVPNRWQRIVSALGQNNQWIEKNDDSQPTVE